MYMCIQCIYIYIYIYMMLVFCRIALVISIYPASLFDFQNLVDSWNSGKATN